MRDGDVYHWRWKDDERDADCGPFRAYHCYSQIAVVKNGELCDTFWSDCSGAKVLDPSEIILDLRGNINDMSEIPEWEMPYYRPEAVVDMRHSNNSRAPIYLKAGAKRDAGVMLERVREKQREAERNIEFAQRRIKDMMEQERLILAGDLDAVYL